MTSIAIPLELSTIGAESVKTCNARSVHAELGVKKDFSDWIKAQISFDYEVESLLFAHGPIAAGALLLELVAGLPTNPQRALEMLADFRSSGLIPDQLARLADAVEADLFREATDRAQQSGLSERDLQDHFFANLHHYLPGAAKARVQSRAGSMPDGFVQVGGKVAPVEVKLEHFGERALSQLLGYMRRYRLDFGVAVAQRCVVELPSAVTFVQVSEGDVRDPRFGTVHSYHESVLQAVLASALPASKEVSHG